MKSIMRNAWRIAKRAASKFSGSAKDFFAESLKLAWKEHKMSKENTTVKEVVTAYVNAFNAEFNADSLGEYKTEATVWTPDENRTRIYFKECKNKFSKIWVEILRKGTDFIVTYDTKAASDIGVMMSAEMFVDHAENIFEY